MTDRFLEIPLGVQVCVPDVITQMTTYVLEEQGDWFEDEIKFLRKVIRPGMRCIDVGANHGVYALTLAKLVGKTGKVWAIEPDPVPMKKLRKSIEKNKFKNLSPIEVGLSDRNGKAALYWNGGSELNSLTPALLFVGPGGMLEVDVETLDLCARRHEINNVDFLKLDAEGEELRILDGGQAFLKNESPLIMFEFNATNVALVERFAALGYASYRLVPGLDMLVPFSLGGPADSFQLNLFCCQSDRAKKLERRGLLATAVAASQPVRRGAWREFLVDLPYAGRMFKGKWQPDFAAYDHALCAYACAHTAKSPKAKYAHLLDALQCLNGLMTSNTNIARLMTLARVTWEFGLRDAAVHVLIAIVGLLQQGHLPEEPFVPVSPRFDTIDPGDKLKEWCLSSVLEQLELLHSFSTFFDPNPSVGNLELIARLGFQGDQMKRRLDVVRKRVDYLKGKP